MDTALQQVEGIRIELVEGIRVKLVKLAPSTTLLPERLKGAEANLYPFREKPVS